MFKNGTYDITHGGWVQNDEALSDLKSLIIMYDSGLQFLYSEFDEYLPTVAFSIDAFGHSSLTPYLLEAMGYEGILINRFSSKLKEDMNRNQKMIFKWEGDLGK